MDEYDKEGEECRLVNEFDEEDEEALEEEDEEEEAAALLEEAKRVLSIKNTDGKHSSPSPAPDDRGAVDLITGDLVMSVFQEGTSCIRLFSGNSSPLNT